MVTWAQYNIVFHSVIVMSSLQENEKEKQSVLLFDWDRASKINTVDKQTCDCDHWLKCASNPTTSIFGTTRFFKIQLLSYWFCTQHRFINFILVHGFINLVVTFSDQCHWAFHVSPNTCFKSFKSNLFDIGNINSMSEHNLKETRFKFKLENRSAQNVVSKNKKERKLS